MLLWLSWRVPYQYSQGAILWTARPQKIAVVAQKKETPARLKRNLYIVADMAGATIVRLMAHAPAPNQAHVVVVC